MALQALEAAGKPAIFVGGTGLYFRSLTEGLSAIPEVPGEVRAEAAARWDALGGAVFRKELLARDPAMARLAPADRQRHLRAWEVLTATGRPLSSFQAQTGEALIPATALRVVVAPGRDALYAACEARLEKMVKAGGLEEAQDLLSRGLDPDLPVMKALGAAELMAHLRGEISLADAIDLAKRNTRRFAKRQLTWFRNQTADWPRAHSSEAAAATILAGFGHD